jgi:hypothetical protein
MSEHTEKAHPVGAMIMVLILAVLSVLGLSLMNKGETVGLAIAGAMFVVVGLIAVFILGRD